MATFHITTDRATYYPGDTVSGRVFVLIPATISNTEGISLKFTGVQSLKWQEHLQTKAQHFSNPSQQFLQTNKVGTAGQEQAYHVHVFDVLKQQANELSVSQCFSEENKKASLKPKFLKTAENKYYQVKHFQHNNEISRGVAQLMSSGKLQAGQYSFPFSFQTSPKWPASFKQISSLKKVNVAYSLTVSLEPFSARFQFKQRKQIVFCDKTVSKKINQFQSQVSSFYCLKKGSTQLRVSLDKQGYLPAESGEVIIQLDNNHCEVDIQSMTVTLTHSQFLKIGENTPRSKEIFKKQVNCRIKAGQQAIGANSLRVPFIVPKTPSTTQAQLISSSYTLSIQLKHDVLMHKNESFTIPLTVYPQSVNNQIPWEMRSKWQPKTMSALKLAISNCQTAKGQDSRLK